MDKTLDNAPTASMSAVGCFYCISCVRNLKNWQLFLVYAVGQLILAKLNVHESFITELR